MLHSAQANDFVLGSCLMPAEAVARVLEKRSLYRRIRLSLVAPRASLQHEALRQGQTSMRVREAVAELGAIAVRPTLRARVSRFACPVSTRLDGTGSWGDCSHGC